jgi:hypothetical protein
MGLRQQAEIRGKYGIGLQHPFSLAGAPTSGASGSFVGRAVPGSLLVDTVGGKLYVATNATTSSSVTWQVAGLQT